MNGGSDEDAGGAAAALRSAAAVVSILVALLASPCGEFAMAQISPGQLARPHAFMDGIRHCLKCHSLGSGPSVKKCLDCHKEIAMSLDNRHGYHHLAVAQETKPCFECHGDHAGRDFQLVYWPGGVNAFDHQRTGYPLEGKHRRSACRECHNPRFLVDDLSRFGDQVNLQKTYLGLRDRCVTCHTDAHRSKLDADCLKCHDHERWKPAPLFDHAKTRYPLTGKHQDVTCGKCHRPSGSTRGPSGEYPAIRYTDVPHNDCARCHKDVHKEKFKKTCASCHSTGDWRKLDNRHFDHSLTAFPLKGRHGPLACEKCHAPGNRKTGLAHDRCADCHADIHAGQFVARSDRGACESCHNEIGFVPSLYTPTDHQKSRYPLEGAHLAQPCISCHTTDARARAGHAARGTTAKAGRPTASTMAAATRKFIFDDRTCSACHKDPHEGQFKKSKAAQKCDDCHRTSEWTSLVFDHDRDSTYRLEGEHRRVACAGCHPTVSSRGRKTVHYKPIDPSCKTCHSQKGLELNTAKRR